MRSPRWVRRAGLLAAAALALGAQAAPAQAELRGDEAIRAWQQTSGVLDPWAGGAEGSAFDPPQAPSLGLRAAAGPLARMAALDPAVGGRWDRLPDLPADFNAIHSITGPGGKVLMIAGSGNQKGRFDAGRFTSFIFDTRNNSYRAVATPEDLFCAGHVMLRDGRALIVGGTLGYDPYKGLKSMYAFNFGTERYERLANMAVGRWYPTPVTMPDGRVVIVSGLNESGSKTNVNEIYDPASGRISRLPGTRTFPLYANLVLTAKGRLFYGGTSSGTGTAAGVWDPFTGSFATVSGLAVPDKRTASATCFVGDVRDQNLMVMGGGFPGQTSTSVVKLSESTPVFRAGPSLKVGKAYVSCVNLPDGNLLEANGGTWNTSGTASTEAATLRSVSSSWTAMNPMPAGNPRVYHSMLCVLDDGSVLSLGSDPYQEPSTSPTVLRYSPPYLFKGARPSITAAPTRLAYGGSYSVAASTAAGTSAARVTLIRPSASTHSLDADQRYTSLTLSGGRFSFSRSAAELPPGKYRLSVVASNGVPSVARWVDVG